MPFSSRSAIGSVTSTASTTTRTPNARNACTASVTNVLPSCDSLSTLRKTTELTFRRWPALSSVSNLCRATFRACPVDEALARPYVVPFRRLVAATRDDVALLKSKITNESVSI